MGAKPLQSNGKVTEDLRGLRCDVAFRRVHAVRVVNSGTLVKK
jgi:hypothetical protein